MERIFDIGDTGYAVKLLERGRWITLGGEDDIVAKGDG
jgi:hypothetical protein